MKLKHSQFLKCVFKKLEDGQSSKKKIMSVNLSGIILALLDFMTLEGGTNSLSQNVGEELPPNTA